MKTRAVITMCAVFGVLLAACVPPSYPPPSSTTSSSSTSTPTTIAPSVPWPGAVCVGQGSSVAVGSFGFNNTAAFSADGRFYVGTADTDLIGGSPATDWGLYVVDRILAKVCRVPGFAIGVVSANGRYVAAVGSSGFGVFDMTTGTSSTVSPAPPVTDPDHSVRPAHVSNDGRYVTWTDHHVSAGLYSIHQTDRVAGSDTTITVTGDVLSVAFKSASTDGSRVLWQQQVYYPELMARVWHRDGSPEDVISHLETSPVGDPSLDHVLYVDVAGVPTMGVWSYDVATDVSSNVLPYGPGVSWLSDVDNAASSTAFAGPTALFAPGPCTVDKVVGGSTLGSATVTCMDPAYPLSSGELVTAISSSLNVVAVTDMAAWAAGDNSVRFATL
jgi:hypothetical protein